MKISVNVIGDKFIGIADTIVICCHVHNYKISNFSNTLVKFFFSIHVPGPRGGRWDTGLELLNRVLPFTYICI